MKFTKAKTVKAENENSYTIMIVDDQEINLAILDDILTPLGYDVIKARNGEEALGLISQSIPDLMLLDIVMPVMDGNELCKRLKEDPSRRDIPVVMVTSLEGTEEMVKSLECGADDFLTKPVNPVELKARVQSLLKKKSLHDQLKGAYRHINGLTDFADMELSNLSHETFSYIDTNGTLVAKLLRRAEEETDRPTHILLGKWIDKERVAGSLYSSEKGRPSRDAVRSSFKERSQSADTIPSGSKAIYLEENRDPSNWRYAFGNEISAAVGAIKNYAVFKREQADDIIIAFNYGRSVSEHESDVMKNLLLLANVFTVISSQMDEIDNAFKYLISALSRAAEAKDEETASHLLRVNRFAEIIAEELKMPPQFSRDISFLAQMHDVGKLHIPHKILKKPGRLNDDEISIVKNHTYYGANILGDEPRLVMAREIALCHHESFDGSGYPEGIKGEQIPISARIVTLTDVYDALRSQRTYKPAIPHDEVFKIITEGDGRTMPTQFDPDVISAFIKREKDFEEIYHQLRDELEAERYSPPRKEAPEPEKFIAESR